MRKEEVARETYEAFNRGDMAKAVQQCVPDVEFQRVSALGTVHGRHALAEFWEPDAFESMRIEPQEFIERGDRLFVTAKATGRGAGSGIEIDQQGFHVMTFRGDLVARIEVYLNREEALAAFNRDRDQARRMGLEEIARATYEAFNRRDYDAILEQTHADAELQRPSGLGSVRGHEELRKFWEPDAFDWEQVDPEEFIERGDRVFVAFTGHARGAGSGVVLNQRAFHVIVFSDGKISRLEIYFDREEALAALNRDSD